MPELQDVIAICETFEIGIQELLFTDLEKDNIKSEAFFTLFDSSSILKFNSNKYYGYYLDENKEGNNQRIRELTFVFTKDNSVNVVFDGQNSASIQCRINFDGSYAYIDGHDYDKDLYVHITFYYHRSSLYKIYYGGIGLLETRDCFRLPTCRLCMISINRVPSNAHKYIKDLLGLDFTKESLNKLSERTISNACTLRLTKEKDKEAFEWLKRNNIINPRN